MVNNFNSFIRKSLYTFWYDTSFKGYITKRDTPELCDTGWNNIKEMFGTEVCITLDNYFDTIYPRYNSYRQTRSSTTVQMSDTILDSNNENDCIIIKIFKIAEKRHISFRDFFEIAYNVGIAIAIYDNAGYSGDVNKFFREINLVKIENFLNLETVSE